MLMLQKRYWPRRTHISFSSSAATTYLSKGIEAIHTALNDATLRPHFASIEAKRIAKPFPGQDVNLDEAARLIRGGDVVMSGIEKAKLEKWGVTCG